MHSAQRDPIQHKHEAIHVMMEIEIEHSERAAAVDVAAALVEKTIENVRNWMVQKDPTQHKHGEKHVIMEIGIERFERTARTAVVAAALVDNVGNWKLVVFGVVVICVVVGILGATKENLTANPTTGLASSTAKPTTVPSMMNPHQKRNMDLHLASYTIFVISFKKRFEMCAIRHIYIYHG